MSRSGSGGFSRPRGPHGPGRSEIGAPSGQTKSKSVFDPAKPLADLVDGLAEEQARMMPDHANDRLNSNQLRRFFGDVKDLFRQLERGSDYGKQIEPSFKMIRSKANYAWRNCQRKKIPREFYDFIENGVSKVKSEQDFRAFVRHFEAVVGFLYGLGKVGK